MTNNKRFTYIDIKDIVKQSIMNTVKSFSDLNKYDNNLIKSIELNYGYEKDIVIDSNLPNLESIKLESLNNARSITINTKTEKPIKLFIYNCEYLENLNIHNSCSDIKIFYNGIKLVDNYLSINLPDNLDSLNNISISNNKMKEIFIKSLPKSLVRANFSNNGLYFFEFLSDTPSLIDLNLDNNNLSSVDFSNNLKNLQRLSIDNNKLKCINFNTILPNIKELILSRNLFFEFNLNTSIKGDNVSFMKLSLLSFTGNKLSFTLHVYYDLYYLRFLLITNFTAMKKRTYDILNKNSKLQVVYDEKSLNVNNSCNLDNVLIV